MVMVLEDHAAVTPEGRPVAVPIPVALTVVWVIAVKTVLIHKVGVDEAAVTVFAAVTVIVPVALITAQPPDNGIE